MQISPCAASTFGEIRAIAGIFPSQFQPDALTIQFLNPHPIRANNNDLLLFLVTIRNSEKIGG